LQEYLSLIERPSKTKTWANGEDFPPNTVQNQPPTSDQQEDQSDDTTEQVEEPSHNQRKKVRVEEKQKVDHGQEPEPMVLDKTEEEHEGTNADEPAEAVSHTQEEPEPVSDTDWLRSKTSRLLGLLDEDEQAEFDSAAQQKPDPSPQPAALLKADVQQSNDGKTAVESSTEAEEVDTNIENIRLSSRLFVRNLPYDASESDLEPVFSKFGKVEEVRIILPFSYCPPRLLPVESCSNDDLPDRDI
jgi:multiple RNA-binding domain-containing protein 1